MKKKIISILALVIIASVLLIGCGNKSTSTTSKFLGNWQDIKTPSRFAKIYANGNGGYTWEDNEGKYVAHFDKDTLKVAVEKYFAVIVYDKTTDHLKATLLNDHFEFKRK